jgi:membrane-associated phospholipid phosphatase
MASSKPQTWIAQFIARSRYLLLLKFAGITAFTWLFFIGYFHLLRHPAYPSMVMHLTALDRLIPFQPVALYAYLSLWLYVGIAPGLQATFLELIVYGLWIGALCLTGLALFYFWPTEVPRVTLEVGDFPGFALLKGVDAAGNACPSMHVAVAVFSAIWLESVLREIGAPTYVRAINGLWFAAIAFSTVAIKQHVVLDAIAGLLLGVAYALPSLRWRPHRRSTTEKQAPADMMGHQRARADQ